VFFLLLAIIASGCAANKSPSAILAGLQSENPSKRMEACIAAAQQRERSAVPLLVDRLGDSDADVRFCAIRALCDITSQTFGYEYYQDEGQRAEAVARWRQWLREQASSQPAGPSKEHGR
jgi:HEAT repeat protein